MATEQLTFSESARLEAQVLLAHSLGVDRSWILANGDQLADFGSANLLLEKRRNREPLAYIIGEREVDQAVKILAKVLKNFKPEQN